MDHGFVIGDEEPDHLGMSLGFLVHAVGRKVKRSNFPAIAGLTHWIQHAGAKILAVVSSH